MKKLNLTKIVLFELGVIALGMLTGTIAAILINKIFHYMLAISICAELLIINITIDELKIITKKESR